MYSPAQPVSPACLYFVSHTRLFVCYSCHCIGPDLMTHLPFHFSGTTFSDTAHTREHRCTGTNATVTELLLPHGGGAADVSCAWLARNGTTLLPARLLPFVPLLETLIRPHEECPLVQQTHQKPRRRTFLKQRQQRPSGRIGARGRYFPG